MGYVLVNEPLSGFTVRARFANHHTAGHFFTRDDREGHGDPPHDPAHWFSHTDQEWVSWSGVKWFAEHQNEPMFLEPMYAPPPLPGCSADGACGDGCPKFPEL